MQIENFNIFSISLFLIITGILVFLFLKNYTKREKLRKEYKLLFEQKKSFYLRYIALIISCIIIALSLFQISYYSGSLMKNTQGLDIVFVLDVSKSMNAHDVKGGSISRLEYSKEIMSNYISENPSNRYALIIFAGDALSITPLTNNIPSFLTNLSRVNYTNIATQGTDILKALELGYARFKISEESTGKALILISDGGDEEKTENKKILSQINTQTIPSFILGVGTKGGEKIPIGRDPFGSTIYQTYKGNTVVTKLNEKKLKQTAEYIDGVYLHINNFDSQLDSIQKKVMERVNEKYRQDFTGILSIIALFFFLVYFLFPVIGRGKK